MEAETNSLEDASAKAFCLHQVTHQTSAENVLPAETLIDVQNQENTNIKHPNLEGETKEINPTNTIIKEQEKVLESHTGEDLENKDGGKFKQEKAKETEEATELKLLKTGTDRPPEEKVQSTTPTSEIVKGDTEEITQQQTHKNDETAVVDTDKSSTEECELDDDGKFNKEEAKAIEETTKTQLLNTATESLPVEEVQPRLAIFAASAQHNNAQNIQQQPLHQDESHAIDNGKSCIAENKLDKMSTVVEEPEQPETKDNVGTVIEEQAGHKSEESNVQCVITNYITAEGHVTPKSSKQLADAVDVNEQKTVESLLVENLDNKSENEITTEEATDAKESTDAEIQKSETEGVSEDKALQILPSTASVGIEAVDQSCQEDMQQQSEFDVTYAKEEQTAQHEFDAEEEIIEEETCLLNAENEPKSESQPAAQNEDTTSKKHPYMAGETAEINPTADTKEEEEDSSFHAKEKLAIKDDDKFYQEEAKGTEEETKIQLLNTATESVPKDKALQTIAKAGSVGNEAPDDSSQEERQPEEEFTEKFNKEEQIPQFDTEETSDINIINNVENQREIPAYQAKGKQWIEDNGSLDQEEAREIEEATKMQSPEEEAHTTLPTPAFVHGDTDQISQQQSLHNDELESIGNGKSCIPEIEHDGNYTVVEESDQPEKKDNVGIVTEEQEDHQSDESSLQSIITNYITVEGPVTSQISKILSDDVDDNEQKTIGSCKEDNSQNKDARDITAEEATDAKQLTDVDIPKSEIKDVPEDKAFQTIPNAASVGKEAVDESSQERQPEAEFTEKFNKDDTEQISKINTINDTKEQEVPECHASKKLGIEDDEKFDEEAKGTEEVQTTLPAPDFVQGDADQILQQQSLHNDESEAIDDAKNSIPEIEHDRKSTSVEESEQHETKDNIGIVKEEQASHQSEDNVDAVEQNTVESCSVKNLENQDTSEITTEEVTDAKQSTDVEITQSEIEGVHEDKALQAILDKASVGNEADDEKSKKDRETEAEFMEKYNEVKTPPNDNNETAELNTTNDTETQEEIPASHAKEKLGTEYDGNFNQAKGTEEATEMELYEEEIHTTIPTAAFVEDDSNEILQQQTLQDDESDEIHIAKNICTPETELSRKSTVIQEPEQPETKDNIGIVKQEQADHQSEESRVLSVSTNYTTAEAHVTSESSTKLTNDVDVVVNAGSVEKLEDKDACEIRTEQSTDSKQLIDVEIPNSETNGVSEDKSLQPTLRNEAVDKSSQEERQLEAEFAEKFNKEVQTPQIEIQETAEINTNDTEKQKEVRASHAKEKLGIEDDSKFNQEDKEIEKANIMQLPHEEVQMTLHTAAFVQGDTDKILQQQTLHGDESEAIRIAKNIFSPEIEHGQNCTVVEEPEKPETKDNICIVEEEKANHQSEESIMSTVSTHYTTAEGDITSESSSKLTEDVDIDEQKIVDTLSLENSEKKNACETKAEKATVANQLTQAEIPKTENEDVHENKAQQTIIHEALVGNNAVDATNQEERLPEAEFTKKVNIQVQTPQIDGKEAAEINTANNTEKHEDIPATHSRKKLGIEDDTDLIVCDDESKDIVIGKNIWMPEIEHGRESTVVEENETPETKDNIGIVKEEQADNQSEESSVSSVTTKYTTAEVHATSESNTKLTEDVDPEEQKIVDTCSVENLENKDAGEIAAEKATDPKQSTDVKIPKTNTEGVHEDKDQQTIIHETSVGNEAVDESNQEEKLPEAEFADKFNIEVQTPQIDTEETAEINTANDAEKHHDIPSSHAKEKQGIEDDGNFSQEEKGIGEETKPQLREEEVHTTLLTSAFVHGDNDQTLHDDDSEAIVIVKNICTPEIELGGMSTVVKELEKPETKDNISIVKEEQADNQSEESSMSSVITNYTPAEGHVTSESSTKLTDDVDANENKDACEIAADKATDAKQLTNVDIPKKETKDKAFEVIPDASMVGNKAVDESSQEKRQPEEEFTEKFNKEVHPPEYFSEETEIINTTDDIEEQEEVLVSRSEEKLAIEDDEKFNQEKAKGTEETTKMQLPKEEVQTRLATTTFVQGDDQIPQQQTLHNDESEAIDSAKKSCLQETEHDATSTVAEEFVQPEMYNNIAILKEEQPNNNSEYSGVPSVITNYITVEGHVTSEGSTELIDDVEVNDQKTDLCSVENLENKNASGITAEEATDAKQSTDVKIPKSETNEDKALQTIPQAASIRNEEVDETTQEDRQPEEKFHEEVQTQQIEIEETAEINTTNDTEKQDEVQASHAKEKLGTEDDNKFSQEEGKQIKEAAIMQLPEEVVTAAIVKGDTDQIPQQKILHDDESEAIDIAKNICTQDIELGQKSIVLQECEQPETEGNVGIVKEQADHQSVESSVPSVIIKYTTAGGEVTSENNTKLNDDVDADKQKTVDSHMVENLKNKDTSQISEEKAADAKLLTDEKIPKSETEGVPEDKSFQTIPETSSVGNQALHESSQEETQPEGQLTQKNNEVVQTPHIDTEETAEINIINDTETQEEVPVSHAKEMLGIEDNGNFDREEVKGTESCRPSVIVNYTSEGKVKSETKVEPEDTPSQTTPEIASVGNEALYESSREEREQEEEFTEKIKEVVQIPQIATEDTAAINTKMLGIQHNGNFDQEATRTEEDTKMQIPEEEVLTTIPAAAFVQCDTDQILQQQTLHDHESEVIDIASNICKLEIELDRKSTVVKEYEQPETKDSVSIEKEQAEHQSVESSVPSVITNYTTADRDIISERGTQLTDDVIFDELETIDSRSAENLEIKNAGETSAEDAVEAKQSTDVEIAKLQTEGVPEDRAMKTIPDKAFVQNKAVDDSTQEERQPEAEFTEKFNEEVQTLQIEIEETAEINTTNDTEKKKRDEVQSSHAKKTLGIEDDNKFNQEEGKGIEEATIMQLPEEEVQTTLTTAAFVKVDTDQILQQQTLPDAESETNDIAKNISTPEIELDQNSIVVEECEQPETKDNIGIAKEQADNQLVESCRPSVTVHHTTAEGKVKSETEVECEDKPFQTIPETTSVGNEALHESSQEEREQEAEFTEKIKEVVQTPQIDTEDTAAINTISGIETQEEVPVTYAKEMLGIEDNGNFDQEAKGTEEETKMQIPEEEFLTTLPAAAFVQWETDQIRQQHTLHSHESEVIDIASNICKLEIELDEKSSVVKECEQPETKDSVGIEKELAEDQSVESSVPSVIINYTTADRGIISERSTKLTDNVIYDEPQTIDSCSAENLEIKHAGEISAEDAVEAKQLTDVEIPKSQTEGVPEDQAMQTIVDKASIKNQIVDSQEERQPEAEFTEKFNKEVHVQTLQIEIEETTEINNTNDTEKQKQDEVQPSHATEKLGIEDDNKFNQEEGKSIEEVTITELPEEEVQTALRTAAFVKGDTDEILQQQTLHDSESETIDIAKNICTPETELDQKSIIVEECQQPEIKDNASIVKEQVDHQLVESCMPSVIINYTTAAGELTSETEGVPEDKSLQTIPETASAGNEALHESTQEKRQPEAEYTQMTKEVVQTPQIDTEDTAAMNTINDIETQEEVPASHAKEMRGIEDNSNFDQEEAKGIEEDTKTQLPEEEVLTTLPTTAFVQGDTDQILQQQTLHDRESEVIDIAKNICTPEIEHDQNSTMVEEPEQPETKANASIAKEEQADHQSQESSLESVITNYITAEKVSDDVYVNEQKTVESHSVEVSENTDASKIRAEGTDSKQWTDVEIQKLETDGPAEKEVQPKLDAPATGQCNTDQNLHQQTLHHDESEAIDNAKRCIPENDLDRMSTVVEEPDQPETKASVGIVKEEQSDNQSQESSMQSVITNYITSGHLTSESSTKLNYDVSEQKIVDSQLVENLENKDTSKITKEEATDAKQLTELEIQKLEGDGASENKAMQTLPNTASVGSEAVPDSRQEEIKQEAEFAVTFAKTMHRTQYEFNAKNDIPEAYGEREDTCHLNAENKQKSESQPPPQNEGTTFTNHPHQDGETAKKNPINAIDEEEIPATHAKEKLVIEDDSKFDQEEAQGIEEATKTLLLNTAAESPSEEEVQEILPTPAIAEGDPKQIIQQQTLYNDESKAIDKAKGCIPENEHDRKLIVIEEPSQSETKANVGIVKEEQADNQSPILNMQSVITNYITAEGHLASESSKKLSYTNEQKTVDSQLLENFEIKGASKIEAEKANDAKQSTDVQIQKSETEDIPEDKALQTLVNAASVGNETVDESHQKEIQPQEFVVTYTKEVQTPRYELDAKKDIPEEETCQLTVENEQKSQSQPAVQNEETTLIKHPYSDGETAKINPTNDIEEQVDIPVSPAKEKLGVEDDGVFDQEEAKGIEEATKTQLLNTATESVPEDKVQITLPTSTIVKGETVEGIVQEQTLEEEELAAIDNKSGRPENELERMANIVETIDQHETMTEVSAENEEHAHHHYEQSSMEDVITKPINSEGMVTTENSTKSSYNVEEQELEKVLDSKSIENSEIKDGKNIFPEEASNMKEATDVPEDKAMSTLPNIASVKVEIVDESIQEAIMQKEAEPEVTNTKEEQGAENDFVNNMEVLEAFDLHKAPGNTSLENEKKTEVQSEAKSPEIIIKHPNLEAPDTAETSPSNDTKELEEEHQVITFTGVSESVSAVQTDTGKPETPEAETAQLGSTKEDEAGDEFEKISPSSSVSVISRESQDTDTMKVLPKKSHGILSGVGSKVKHSISKVKKAITGKSSHPKTPPSSKQE